MKFCEIWCEQLDKGNNTLGVMSNSGWKEVIDRLHATMGLRLSRIKIKIKIRALRAYHSFIKDKLRVH
jgi:hypothetical protein